MEIYYKERERFNARLRDIAECLSLPYSRLGGSNLHIEYAWNDYPLWVRTGRQLFLRSRNR